MFRRVYRFAKEYSKCTSGLACQELQRCSIGPSRQNLWPWRRMTMCYRRYERLQSHLSLPSNPTLRRRTRDIHLRSHAESLQMLAAGKGLNKSRRSSTRGECLQTQRLGVECQKRADLTSGPSSIEDQQDASKNLSRCLAVKPGSLNRR